MRKVVLCGIPHHSNLGDHAIYIAEKNLILIKGGIPGPNKGTVVIRNAVKA